VKYSPNGGAVEVSTERGGGTVTLTIRDHGIGISSDKLERIFERYPRIESVETCGIQGTGLGLPIARPTPAVLRVA
jgi:signal transduction histidine kinase